MKVIATGTEIQAVDACTINEIGIPSMVLMERAALAVVQVLMDYMEELDLFGYHYAPTVLVVTEGGNNGGDGLAIARLLSERGCSVDVYQVGGLKRESEQYQQQKHILQQLHIDIKEGITTEEMKQWKHSRYDVVVDALFGVGLHREIVSPQKEVLEALNALGGLKCAVDMPSGIDSTTGHLYGTAFRADLTVTFGCMKTGQLLNEGPDYCGDVITADIGFPAVVFEKQSFACYAYESEELKCLLPVRKSGGNKGTFGKVAIVAGSETVCGAALLSAEAAYRTGCGLVKVVTHINNREAIQEKLPEALLQVYQSAEEAEAMITEAAGWADCMVLGPGIGTDETGHRLVSRGMQAECPVILDADAITILSENAAWREQRTASTGMILTPHMKEMERISGRRIGDLKQCPWEEARRFAQENQVICVMKDAHTVVAVPDEESSYMNLSGNDGMATGGSGDVLTGMIAALVAQGLTLSQAAKSGVFLHGLAGDRASELRGAASMLAGDIISGLESVLRDIHHHIEGKQENYHEMV